MNTTPDNDDHYNLSEDFPIYYKLTHKRILNSQTKLAILSVCLVWLPLVIFSALDGKLYSGVEMPFLYDIAMQARMLIAVPMLILIKDNIDEKLTIVCRHICNTLMSTEDREAFIATHIQKAKKRNNSVFTNVVILLIIIVFTSIMVKGGIYAALESGITSWMTNISDGQNSLSIAGYWCIFISIPLLQFFGLRWLWQYVVWVLLLFRFSKANLKLLPTHADNSAGIGIVVLAQQSFNLFFVVFAVILSGELTTHLIANPDSFDIIRKEGLFFIVICMFLLIAPLFFFVKKLTKVKTDGLIQLSVLSASLSNKFEKEWVNNILVEQKLEEHSIDPSLVCDYNAVYNSLQELKIFPMTMKDLIPMGAMLFIPFIPILFIHFSVAELMQRITGMLL